MSLVQAANQAVLQRLRDWLRISKEDQADLLKHCSALLGHNFHQAMIQFEKGPDYVQIRDYDLYYELQILNDRQVVFKDKRGRTTDCTCFHSWRRKTGEVAAYMCLHQIAIQLAFTIYADRVVVEHADTGVTDRLEPLLGKQ